MLRNMAADKSLTVSEICKTLDISRKTYYRYLQEEQQ
jgi:predicted DNA-binding transcriptional regulator AlpA